MPHLTGFFFCLGFLLIKTACGQTYSATYLPSNVPPTTEQGQTGTNQCGTSLNQTSDCQNAYSKLKILLTPLQFFLIPFS